MGFTHKLKINAEKVGNAKEILKKILEHPNLYALGYIDGNDEFRGVFNVDSLNLSESEDEIFCKTRRLPYDLILRAMAHINAHLPKEERFAESWQVGDEYGEDLLAENISTLGGYFWDKSQDVKNEFKSVLRELEAHIVRNEPKQYSLYRKLEKNLLDTSMTLLETDDPTLTLKEIVFKELKQKEPKNTNEFTRIQTFSYDKQVQQMRPNFENSDGRASTVYDYMETQYNAFIGNVKNGDMGVLTSYLRTLGHFYGISSNNSFLLHSQAITRGIQIENMKPFGVWAKMQNDEGKKVSVLKGSKGFDFIKATSIPVYEKYENGTYVLDNEGKKIIATNEDGEEQFFYRYIVEKRFDINQTNAKSVMGIDDSINEPNAMIQRLREVIPNSSFEHKNELLKIFDDNTLNANEQVITFFEKVAQEVNAELQAEIITAFSLRLGRVVVNNYTAPYENMDISDLKARFKAITAGVRYIAKEVGFEALLREPIEYTPHIEDDARMAPVLQDEAMPLNDNDDVYINDERGINHPSFQLLPFLYDDMFMANDELRNAIRENHKDQAMIRIKNSILSVLIRQNNFFEIVASSEDLKNHYIELSDPNSDAMIALSEAIYNDIKKEQDNESARNKESLNGQFNDDVGQSLDRDETGVSQGANQEQEIRRVPRGTSETGVNSNESINAVGDERNGSMGNGERRVHSNPIIRSKSGLAVGESDGVKKFIGFNVDEHELFEDSSGVRFELRPSENGLPSYFNTESVSMQSSRPSKTRLRQYESFTLQYLTKEEFAEFNKEYGYYTENGSSHSLWYKLEQEMSNEPLDSIFSKARLGIHELKDTYGELWVDELNAMWNSGMYNGLSKDKIPYIQRLKDIPLDKLLYDSKVPEEHVLEVFYPLMSDAQKNVHQDTLDSKINNRVYEIVEALGVSKEQWLNIATFQESEHETNVIGMSVFDMQDDFRPIDEYIGLIKRSKEFQAFSKKEKIEKEMKAFVDTAVKRTHKNTSIYWSNELKSVYVHTSTNAHGNLIVSLTDLDGDPYKDFYYKNFDELKQGFKDAIDTKLGGLMRLEELEAFGFLPSEAERLKAVRGFVGNAQYEIISHSDEHKGTIADIYETVTNMPKTYETDGMGDNAMVVMHYFKNSSDWYVTERDMENKQLQAFGYVVLNGDVDYAELGYINIEELKRLNVEMDFYWEPKTLRQLKQELGGEESDDLIEDEELSNKVENESLISKGDINKLLADTQFEYFNVFSAGKKYDNKTTVEITDNTFILHVGEDADVKLPKNAESNIKKVAGLLNKIKGDIAFEDSRSNLLELDKIDVEARNNFMGHLERDEPKSKLSQIIEASPNISIVRPMPITPKERVFDYLINQSKNELTINNLSTFYSIDEIKEKFINKQVVYQIFAKKYHFDLNNPVHVDILNNELNIYISERSEEAFSDTTVLKDAQSVRDYVHYLDEQYPRFLTTSGMSIKNSSLYSNYIMMDEQNNIKYLHVTHDGRQEWETIDINTAKERLERAYFARYIQEWGLDRVEEEKALEKSVSPLKEVSMDDDFVIQGEVVEGGQKTRFKNNLLAIETIRKLESNQEMTKEDKIDLSKYVGWGGIPQAFYRTDGSTTKGWEKEAEELRSVLTQTEYENARRSTLDSHYTPETVIKAIWASVDKMGFKGGTILEPSVGVGKFFGFMPSHLKPNARILGVELDSLTAKIAQTLYPKTKITNMGFQDYKVDDGSIDLIIGNPPFGSQKIGSEYNNDEKKDFSIHNYFFAKSVDTLKEGGILAMVVSNAFLDARSEGAREYIANQANLIGAIRLPNNAFNEAGTEVTTDIIFIQKRLVGQENNFAEWSSVSEYNDTPINNYFVNHPENLLGDWGKHGTMYRGDEPALIARENDDLVELLNEAIKRLPKDIATSSKIDTTSSSESENEAEDEKIANVRVGAFYHSLGKIYKRLPDVNKKRVREEITFDNEKAQERVLGMIAIAEVGDRLRMMQVNPSLGENEIESSRLELNHAYDAFIKEYDYINNATNKRLFIEDPRSSFLLSLERKYDKGVSRSVAHTTGQKVREPYAEKADIFTKRTQHPYVAPTHASDTKSAMLISLAEYAYLNLNYVASLVNKTRTQVIDELVAQELIFEDPNNGWVTREEYLSGNVKQKLKETNDPRNISALQTVIPADIPAVDISVKAGASWLPPKVIEDFATYITGDTHAKAYYTKYNATWNVDTTAISQANFDYGTQRVNADRVLDAVLNSKQITVYDTTDDDKKIINHEATMAVANKIELVRDRWNDWIWKDEKRRDELGAMYNEKFNIYAKRQYDGSHLVLHGKVSDEIVKNRPHQNNAVWRALQTDNTLLDHTVGTGKTFTGIEIVMEMKRTGRATKPLVAVPNHLTEQWGIDWMKLYPSANILVASKKDFETQNRKVLMARIATGDYDAIIIGHSQLVKIQNDQEFVSSLMREQVNEIQEAIDQIRLEEGSDVRSVKDAERSMVNMEQRLKRMEEYKRDDNLTFKELGIDLLLVDELHEFKNLEYHTRLRGVAGLGDPSGSKKAYDLMLKIREMHERTNGKNLIGATGTSISNTIAEMYTLQRYMQNYELQEQELTHFDAWSKQYAEVRSEWELAPSGKYKLSTRLSKFSNVPELIQQYRQFADVVSNDDINKMLALIGEKLPIPRLKGGKPINVVVDRSPEQAYYIGEPDEKGKYREGSLVYRSENLPTDLSKDNMLKIMSEARKVALDMRIMDKNSPDREISKVNESIKNMLRLYKAWDADKGTQLVFCDLSTPNKSKAGEKARINELIRLADEGDEKAQEELSNISPDFIDALDSSFSVYDDIKAKLIRSGIPESEIAFIHDANTDLQKTELFAKVNSGKVRFLLGSTAKMGAGTNVQERLVGLHNLDAPWRPSDLEQREGRIIRQGNVLYERDPDGFEVEVFRYATKNTLDSRLWQILETKAKFIEQIKTAEMTDREIDDIGSSEAMNSAEMKALSSGNPLILEEMDLKQKIKKLEAIKKDFDRTSFDIVSKIKYFKGELEKAPERIKAYEHDINLTKQIPEKFEVMIDGSLYDKREDAGLKMVDIAKKLEPSQRITIGNFGLFQLSIVRGVWGDGAYLEIQGAKSYEVSFDVREQKAGGLSVKLSNAITKIKEDYSCLLHQNEKARQEIPILESRLNPFLREQELEDLKEKHRDIMSQLQAEIHKEDDESVAREANAPVTSKIVVDWEDTYKDFDSDTMLHKSIKNYAPNIISRLGNYRFVGKCLVLEDKLDRNTYMEFRKVFETFGGVWDKKVEAVVFSEDGLKRMQGVLSNAVKSPEIKHSREEKFKLLQDELNALKTKHKGKVKTIAEFVHDAINDGYSVIRYRDEQAHLYNKATEREYPIKSKSIEEYAKLLIENNKALECFNVKADLKGDDALDSTLEDNQIHIGSKRVIKR